ncbi:GPW/gp25 family protein [Catellatospora chokoriensis]|uniref:IraD/Gp25-like domain-containing protein n=1 Tax=Catellatospora chokoriensis TaxID=310353 RepID=A0A8J3JSP9_9ACTN|nr:GPW/gp25 family protein [Catellatospora chokoriensis]GIF90381.1 hypothetical protein Cch02nite_38250 [Catellatospora chokoriensis]
MHLAFPLRIDSRGRTAVAGDEEYLRGLIEQVLFTRMGERVNRPDFGSGVNSLVFAPAGDELAQGVHAMVHGALQQWLGEVLHVEEIGVQAADNVLHVTVVYRPSSSAADPAERRTIRVSAPGGAP